MSHAVTTIVWFRQDLRLADNPALHAAMKRGGAVVPVYIWSPEEEGDWPPGAASKVWLHDSLMKLHQSLQERGSRLVIARGKTTSILKNLAQATGASQVVWNRRYEPAAIARDAAVETALSKQGLVVN